MIKVNERVFYLIILCAGIIGMKALFHPGFYTSHDGTHQVVRLMHFVQGLKDGQFPVRWAGTALAGYGYPLFIFTYRVPFYSAIGWYTVFRSLTGAIKFSFILSYLLSGWAMYALVKSIWKNRSAALLSSLVYLWAPYRFEVILVRAALGEAWIFVFLPLVFLGLYQLSRPKIPNRLWVILTAVFGYGLVGSHAMLAYMAIPFITGWWVWLLTKHSRPKIFLKNSVITVVLFLAISAFYLFPALFEKKYVLFDQNLGSYFANHFVTLKQLLYSRWGYGFSMPGAQDEMSFQIGFGIWWIVITATITVVWKIWQKTGSKKNMYAGFFLAMFGLSVLMMLSLSAPVYRVANRMMVIDLPWRFLTFTTLAGSILSAFVWLNLSKSWKRFGWLTILLFVIFYGNRNHLKVNQYIHPTDQEYWQNTESSNERDEYRPKAFTISPYDQSDPLIQFMQGEGKTDIITRKSNKIVVNADINSEEAELTYKLAYYPGWRVLIDSQEKPVVLHNGKILIGLNKGKHEVALIWKETGFRKICNLVTAAVLLFMVISYLCLPQKNRK